MDIDKFVGISNEDYFGIFDLEPLEKPEYTGSNQYERWLEFHNANPHVYEYLRTMALALKKRGFRKCGIALLWERLRWLSYIQTFGVDEYKLTNSHRAYYARRLMHNEPELAGFFNVRHQPAEEVQDLEFQSVAQR